MDYKYQEELELAKAAIYEAAELLKSDFDVREKAARDVVTSNDLAVEALITKALLDKYPDDVIISEESRQEIRQGHRAWVIDPIDGTTNYSRRMPLYGIQLAFLVDQKTEFSLIYYVVLKEMYEAIRGGGAFCNNQAIHVGKRTDLEHAIVTLGDFSTTNNTRNAKMLTLMGHLMSKVYKLRIHSSACVDLVFLATGRTDVHIMSANHPWDFLPGLLLVKEAGGLIDASLINSLGEKRTLMVVASSKELYQATNNYIG